jgi:hypothetical protein
MDINLKPETLFLFACIPIRLFLVGLGIQLSGWARVTYGALLLFPAVGFLGLYFSNSRMNASEAGGKTWWTSLRLIHGLLYLGAAIYGLQESSLMWIPLLLDWIIAVVLIWGKQYIVHTQSLFKRFEFL